MPDSTTVKIVTALLGASGWVTAAITYLKWRRETKEKEANILRETRRELDSNPNLQKIVAILTDEQDGRPSQDRLDGWKMRQLPAFLEDLASHWEFDTVSIEGAYDMVGKEVILCDESKLMWRDEQPRRDETYWRLFNKFAKAIQDEKARR